MGEAGRAQETSVSHRTAPGESAPLAGGTVGQSLQPADLCPRSVQVRSHGEEGRMRMVLVMLQLSPGGFDFSWWFHLIR